MNTIFLLYLFDSKVYKWNSFGALEHLSSTTVVYPESYSKRQLANGMINGTVSHEFFHIVTPLICTFRTNSFF